MKGYATDGTPRARGKMRRILGDDDECGLDEVPKPDFVSSIFLKPLLQKYAFAVKSMLAQELVLLRVHTFFFTFEHKASYENNKILLITEI